MSPTSPSDKRDAALALINEIEEIGVGLAISGPSRFGGRVLTLDEDALILEALKAYAPSHAPQISYTESGAMYPSASAQVTTDTSTPSTTPRSDAEYAIEHGRYLAKAAEDFLAACNRVGAIDHEGDATATDALLAAEESRADHYHGLSSAIYEFRKRADRAAASVASATPRFEEKPRAWLIERPKGTGKQATMEYEVVLSPLTDDTFMDEGDCAYPLFRRADGGNERKS